MQVDGQVENGIVGRFDIHKERIAWQKAQCGQIELNIGIPLLGQGNAADKRLALGPAVSRFFSGKWPKRPFNTDCETRMRDSPRPSRKH